MKKILMLGIALTLVAPYALAQRASNQDLLAPQFRDTPLEEDTSLPRLADVLQRAVDQAQQNAREEIQIPRALVAYRHYIENAKVYNKDTRRLIVQFGERVEESMDAATTEQMEIYEEYLNPVEEIIDGKTVKGIRAGWGKLFNWPNDLIAAENQYKEEMFTQDTTVVKAPSVRSDIGKEIVKAIDRIRTCPPELREQFIDSVDRLFYDWHTELLPGEDKALKDYFIKVIELTEPAH